MSLRAAHNGRSRYLLIVRDELAPFLPIYSGSFGQIDGTSLYTVDEHFKIDFQDVDLLDGTTKTEWVINAEGWRAPRSYFKSDRRLSLTTRMKF